MGFLVKKLLIYLRWCDIICYSIIKWKGRRIPTFHLCMEVMFLKIKKNGNTELRVYQIARPIADRLGYSIWDISYVKEGAEWYLRVFIDKEDGITIDDCEAMTRPLSDELDKQDPIQEGYYLEVGSAGLERELIRESHFAACIGKDVRAHLIIAADGIKDYIGQLVKFDKNSVTILTDGEEKEVLLSDTAYIKLYEEFDFE